MGGGPHAVAAAGAVLLDIDAIGRPFGLGDVSWLGGHRALTHSLPFAAALAAVVVAAAYRGPDWRGRRLGVWACFALAFGHHGVLDALTTYGEGVMFLAPFSPEPDWGQTRISSFRCAATER